MKLYTVSLGCAKNQVDTEMILGVLKDDSTLVDDPSLADLILINTCAFIETARKEAIDTILSLADYKKEGAKLIVCGCLAQRYKDEISKVYDDLIDKLSKLGKKLIDSFLLMNILILEILLVILYYLATSLIMNILH